MLPEPHEPKQRPVRRAGKPGQLVEELSARPGLPPGSQVKRPGIHRHDARVKNTACRIDRDGLIAGDRESQSLHRITGLVAEAGHPPDDRLDASPHGIRVQLDPSTARERELVLQADGAELAAVRP